MNEEDEPLTQEDEILYLKQRVKQLEQLLKQAKERIGFLKCMSEISFYKWLTGD